MMRVILGGTGGLLAAFGVFRLVTQIPLDDLAWLAVWLVAALVLHDGLLAPSTAAVGAILERAIPPRLRRYVQAALVTGVGITAIAVPLIVRRNSQPAAKALLQQDYAAHLGWLWAGIAVIALLLYATAVVRNRG